MIGYIHSIETLGLVDGPGIRVVIFMQGCNKRCKYCHNPDTWYKGGSLEMTPMELTDFILKYKNYFCSDGGVTFSGGEPLLQKEFLLETLKLLKDNNINTCIDTSGISGSYDILKYTDLIIFDVKAIDELKYKDLVGIDINDSLKFLDECQKSNTNMWIRSVIVPSINDNEEYINSLVHFIKPLKNILKVELLPYHTKGIHKYNKLNIEYPLKGILDMDINKLNELQSLLIEKLN